MTTSTGSAYPTSVDELVPRVRARAVEQGVPMSRNQIMREFRVGATKARAVMDAVAGVEVDPAQRPEVRAGRRLHAVHTTAEPGPADPGESSHPTAGESSHPTAGETSTPAGRDSSTPDTAMPEEQIGAVVDPGAEITAPPTPDSVTPPTPAAPAPQRGTGGRPESGRVSVRRVRSWRVTLVLLSLPAFVAIWGGWVGLGELTGFGPIHLLPGIVDGLVINSAITLPIGVETYAAFALRVWLSPGGTARARGFAKVSAFGALGLGMVGQVAYHLMSAAGVTRAPWPVTTFVACLPVVVLGCGAALAHLTREDTDEEVTR